MTAPLSLLEAFGPVTDPISQLVAPGLVGMILGLTTFALAYKALKEDHGND